MALVLRGVGEVEGVERGGGGACRRPTDRRVLGWEPRLNDLDTIVGHALGWEKRLIEYRAAS